MKVAAAAGGALALSAIGWREAAAESMSRLQVMIPSDLKRVGGFAHEEALFGIPKYGGSIAERLIHGGVSPGTGPGTIRTWTLCTNEDEEEFRSTLNTGGTPFILMVDRGECTFASKVRRAQDVGAVGVIVADNTCLCDDESKGLCIKEGDIQCENVEPIMADDGSGSDITIPSFLMKKTDAGLVKDRLVNRQTVQIEMAWSLPAPDDRVEWSLWTSAIDTSAAPFKRDFKEVVKTLGKSAQFTPFYVVYDGNSYGCTGGGAATCGSLCTNQGRYCMTDPDFDTKSGVSGADVVTESLRQKCVWNIYGGESAPFNDQGIGEKWWSYVNEFFSSCSVSDGMFNNESCVAKAMKAAGVDKGKVDQCMSDSGGTDADVPNSVLQAELTEKGKNSIVIVPTVFVNNVAERGGISTAAVLSTICAGYADKTAPEVCRCSGQPSSELINSCMTNGGPGGMGGGGGASTSSTLFILVAVVGAMTAAGYVHYKRTQAQMRDQVRGILAEYMPLEDEGSSARVPFMAPNAGGGGTYSVGGTKESQLV